jgi:hypothetical protein
MFTSLLLEYGIQKLDAGQITLVDASVADSKAPVKPAKGLNLRKGGKV